ncbi:hypothetical protein FJY84_01430 [Candidatus Bathyarchaeota archaeon]|nr:hypothetical protein [Candidatus Bathyarchaeota archaeon]
MKFSVTYPEELNSGPISGRVFLLLSDNDEEEPRFQMSAHLDTQLMFGADVDDFKPGTEFIIPDTTYGFPLKTLDEVPTGEYWVQALFHIYDTFHRADGHVIKLHMDHGEGQKWNTSPGNLYSIPKKIKIKSSFKKTIKLRLDQVIPQIIELEDTKYIKHIRIQSKLLTEFWGRPMHLGAVVLLPEDFDDHPQVKYPLIVWHGHFSSGLYAKFQENPPDPKLVPKPLPVSSLKSTIKDPTGPAVVKDPRFYTENNIIVEEHAYKLYKDWTAPHFPRMLLVCIQHPTPYYDDSYAVNSANHGPYGDAINYELIPYIEQKFRGIGESWARTLMGGSTGGWEVFATQVFYPDMYNGCWCWCPDPLDFRDTRLLNIFEDENAYYRIGKWKKIERPGFRTTVGEILFTSEDEIRQELARGTRCRSGGQWDAWTATYSPVAEDGYPKDLVDKYTGKIDHEVAKYWKENYDLRHILEQNWKILGPKLVGKLRIYCGDMDSHYLNNAVYLMEEFLKNTKDPHYGGMVYYGDRFTHCWYGNFYIPSSLDRFELVQRFSKEMAEHITKTAPKGADIKGWRY